MIVGDTLPDIYTVQAIRAANASLGGPVGASYINTTHYYVRFKPADEHELFSLIRYDITDYPLHKEVSEGSYYHDPTVPEDEFTWQYAIVHKDSLNTTVQHQILKTLCLMDEPDGPTGPGGGPMGSPAEPNGPGGPGGPGGVTGMTYQQWQTLEAEAERLAYIQSGGQGGVPGNVPEWRPSGRIRVWDPVANLYVPIEGVTVIISTGTWFFPKTSTVKTDANGNFTSKKKFKKKVEYSIKWESGQTFAINDKGGFWNWLIGNHQAYYKNDTKYNSAWNHDIKGTETKKTQSHLASIYRAACRSFYSHKEYLGMARPKTYSWSRVYIRYYSGEGTGLHNGFLASDVAQVILGPYPSIYIWAKEGGILKSDFKIFRTTIHELGHSNHLELVGLTMYGSANNKICESWADAVEYYVTKLEYTELGHDIETYEKRKVWGYAGMNYLGGVSGPYAGDGPVGNGSYFMTFREPNLHNKQHWPYENYGLTYIDRDDYTSFVVDLVDDCNQYQYYKSLHDFGEDLQYPGVDTGLYPNYVNFPNDNVRGFEMFRIQQQLGTTSWVTFKTRMKALNTQYYSQINSNAQMDELIACF